MRHTHLSASRVSSVSPLPNVPLPFPALFRTAFAVLRLWLSLPHSGLLFVFQTLALPWTLTLLSNEQFCSGDELRSLASDLASATLTDATVLEDPDLSKSQKSSIDQGSENTHRFSIVSIQ